MSMFTQQNQLYKLTRQKGAIPFKHFLANVPIL